MVYQNVHKGIFISRPNRFIANVDIDGQIHTVHVKNTGRCRELLTKGAAVYLLHFDSDKRKTNYDLIAVEKGNMLINMDSQAPNTVFYEWAQKNYPDAEIKREVKYENSRFDCFIRQRERKIFTEVKGVTLEEDGAVKFPDAPTRRGVKHINEMIHAVQNGYEGQIFFVVQMENAEFFTPNFDTHPEFGIALKQARQAGVKILAYTCKVTPDSLEIDRPIPVILDKTI